MYGGREMWENRPGVGPSTFCHGLALSEHPADIVRQRGEIICNRDLVLQCYKIATLSGSVDCAEPRELTEVELHVLQTAKTLAKIIAVQSVFRFVTL